MSQQKIDKAKGAETTCMTCGLQLVCMPFEFQGKDQLSWCDKGTSNKHYNYDSAKNESNCRYVLIMKQMALLNRIENFINTKMQGENEDKKKFYTKLIFNKVLVVDG